MLMAATASPAWHCLTLSIRKKLSVAFDAEAAETAEIKNVSTEKEMIAWSISQQFV